MKRGREEKKRDGKRATKEKERGREETKTGREEEKERNRKGGTNEKERGREETKR